MRVECDLQKALASGKIVSFEGQNMWILFKYKDCLGFSFIVVVSYMGSKGVGVGIKKGNIARGNPLSLDHG